MLTLSIYISQFVNLSIFPGKPKFGSIHTRNINKIIIQILGYFWGVTVSDSQDMTPMIQSQIPSVQPSHPPSAHVPQQFEIGFASASVSESINVEANTDGASRFDLEM